MTEKLRQYVSSSLCPFINSNYFTLKDLNRLRRRAAPYTREEEIMLVFGTYRLHGEVLEIAAAQAVHAMMSHGISQPLVDTAVSYNNTNEIKALVSRYPNILIGTKLQKANQVEQDLQKEKQNYGSNLYRALLHKHMPVSAYLILVQAKAAGKIKEVGISNYSAQEIRNLVAALKALDQAGELPIALSDAIPDVCQNEFHPFLQTTVPQVCNELGIRFEAHSVHTMLNEYPDEILSSGSAGQVAIAFALHRGGGSVVFNSANYEHVLEDLDIITLNEACLNQLDALKHKVTFARYPGSDTARFDPTFTMHLETVIYGSGFVDLPDAQIHNVIAPRIHADMKIVEIGGIPSNFANGIPRIDFKCEKSLHAHLTLANALFVGENGETIVFHNDEGRNTNSKISRLREVLRKIRRAYWEHHREIKYKTKPRTCKLRAIEDPEALPVEIPDPAMLQPFIDLIAEARALPEHAIRLERGVLFPDGRLDFCKQVAQPSFPQLCEAVLRSGIVKHFLIGNNLALADDTGGEREAALIKLIEKSKGIETFYLAGNAINQDQIKSIAEAFCSAKDARYLWLKMNPIKTGSFYLGKMLRANPRIELLDLFNTGQCNDGVNALLHGLKEEREIPKSGLKHLYLDINAITDGNTVAQIVAQLPHLESISLNVNQLRDKGVAEFCDGLLALKTPPPLARLVLGSNGCTDEVLPKLTDLVRHLPNLAILQLGSYKSTKFFKQQANEFTSFDRMLDLARAVAANVTSDVNLFGFQNAYTSDDASELVLAIGNLGLQTIGKQDNTKGTSTIMSKQLNQLLGTPIGVQPAPVKYIQSVYRNNM
jgi:diketogulonate reductase-like aldo/keto reductase